MGELNQNFKSLIENFTFLSRDVLHVYGGVHFFFFILGLDFQKKEADSLFIDHLFHGIN